MLWLEMLFCLTSLALNDSSELSCDAPVDCGAFVGSSGVAAGALIIRAIVIDRPPTRVMIHNSESTEGLRNRITITVVVSEDAGNALDAIVLRHVPNLDQ